MRPGYLYANLERRASERDFSPLLGYKNVRDFISAEVVCGQLMRLAQKPGSCMGIFHICSGKPMSVRDLALEVMNENRISPEETSAMFPETSDEANYMISKPSEI
jgi:nucleoside-diphosphate-sugar epimerase